jgi:DNA processing protein
MGTRFSNIDLNILLGRKLNEVEEKYAPHEIFVAGKMNLPLTNPRVSLIGTRKTSQEGLKIVEELAIKLTVENVVIVSGLARGIDTKSHETTIKSNGQTIGVIGTPLNRFYPPENRELQTELMKNHLVISQFPTDHSTNRFDFITRNRLMALISQATVIVEAGENSGSISQGWESIRLGRKLYIWESTFFNSDLTWPKKMHEYGALPLNWENLSSLVEDLPFSTSAISL